MAVISDKPILATQDSHKKYKKLYADLIENSARPTHPIKKVTRVLSPTQVVHISPLYERIAQLKRNTKLLDILRK